MKDDNEYSLTAKQRKQKRAENQTKRENTENKTAANSDLATQELSMKADVKKTKRSALIVMCVVICAVVLAVFGALILVISSVSNPYRSYSDVIARFELSNGMRLEYTIDEKDYDTAATNFIFLARSGYFDDTVLFDAQDGWVRFGGYEAQPTISSGTSNDYKRTKHHAQNEEYCKKFSQIPSDKFKKVTDKFGYKLRADKGGENASLLDDIGVLCYMYNRSSTEFQLSYKEQAGDSVDVLSVDGTVRPESIKPTMVGRALNDETVNNLIALSQTAAPNIDISSGFKWTPPTPDVKIKSVKVYNLDSAKWRNFDFMTYMDGEDASGLKRLSGWEGRGN